MGTLGRRDATRVLSALSVALSFVLVAARILAPSPTASQLSAPATLSATPQAWQRFAFLAVGILGSGAHLAALHEWAWLGSRDTLGAPTVWQGQGR